MLKKTLLAVSLAATTFGAAQVANACSSFNFVAPDGGRMVGHSMELPVEAHEHLAQIPRGHKFDENGVTAKYGFVGMQHGAEKGMSTFSSGMNEHGVSITAQNLDSVYAPAGEGDMSHWNLGAYILGNAKSVDHAIELLSKVKVFEGNGVFGTMGVHWSVQDNDRAIVVEYTKGDGTPDIHESVGAMTNSPTYDAQVLMAKSKFDTDDLSKAKRNTSNQMGYIGDQSSESRFQRAVFLNTTADFSRDSSKEAILNHTWNMANTFDIPQGTLYWEWLSPTAQTVTHFTVHDLQEMDYYYRTYKDMTIRKVDVNAIDWSKAKYSAFDIYQSVSEYQPVTFN
ncbi:linear amide C-N hydrolase [Paraferrimonas sedimenticola]|uniref:Choloylglycine hydrolase n=1 Tax=Paraferrimonas sedimenticola TaxID=375674 RepID=A0AA37RZ03_9GAMM|nr:linear amide C-N hydrolase [Paraferrimonas sedimenticola]GLP97801.1 choloylglycine hydrolase [Paraferrimonas sedimenticola]